MALEAKPVALHFSVVFVLVEAAVERTVVTAVRVIVDRGVVVDRAVAVDREVDVEREVKVDREIDVWILRHSPPPVQE